MSLNVQQVRSCAFYKGFSSIKCLRKATFRPLISNPIYNSLACSSNTILLNTERKFFATKASTKLKPTTNSENIEPFEITEEEYTYNLIYKKNGKDYDKRIDSLGESFELPYVINDKKHVIANDLFNISTRFGEKVFNDVFKNMSELLDYLVFEPSQEEMNKIFVGRYTYQDQNIKEFIDKTTDEKLLRHDRNVKFLEFYEKQKVENTYSPFMFRMDFINKVKTEKEKYKDLVKSIFVLKDSPVKEEDHFVCHPLVRAFMINLENEELIGYVLSNIRNFIDLYRIWKGYNVIEIETPTEPSKELRKMLEKFALENIPRENQNGINEIIFSLGPRLKAGFLIKYNSKILDFSLNTNYMLAKKEFLQEKFSVNK